MYFNDHPPPHFHARYGGDDATIEIESLRVLAGALPARALDLVMAWAAAHRVELLGNWYRCRENRTPAKIDPLV